MKDDGPSDTPHASAERDRLTLLLRHTDSTAAATSGLGVLSTNPQTPVVTETTVSTDLLQAFQILAKLAVDTVGQNLRVLAIDDIALPVEKPRRNFVLSGVLNDGDNPLQFFRGEFTSPLVQVNIGFLADQVGITTSNALDFGETVHDLLLAFHVRVEETQDVLKGRFFIRDERHDGGVDSSTSIVVENGHQVTLTDAR